MKAIQAFDAITSHERWCEEEGEHAREYRSLMRTSIDKIGSDQKWLLRVMFTLLLSVVGLLLHAVLPGLVHGG